MTSRSAIPRVGGEDFHAGTAVEDLRNELVVVAALAEAASRTLEELPPKASRKLWALVIATSDAAATLLGRADEAVGRLGQTALSPPPPRRRRHRR